MESFPRGTCMEMCPLEEVKLRERERLLHPLEIMPGTERARAPKAAKERMVKAFSRSAAGRQTRVGLLRPTEVLLKTIRYLLSDVVTSKKLPWYATYDFITDRLMAVRQDMVIQDLSPVETITILQPIVRFHAYAAYRLCETSAANFDPTLNSAHLQECLKKLLSCYDCYYYLSNMEYFLENRPEFEALYFVFNLGNEEALRRFFIIPKECKTPLVKSAFELSLCSLYGNYVRVCRIIKKLPFLLAAVAVLRLPVIRKKSFDVMSIGYSSKNLAFPLKDLKEILLYNDEEELITDCTYYGIPTHEKGVCFTNKGRFDSKKVLPARHEKFVDEMFVGENVEYVLLGM